MHRGGEKHSPEFSAIFETFLAFPGFRVLWYKACKRGADQVSRYPEKQSRAIRSLQGCVVL